jgi:hypothetical protein
MRARASGALWLLSGALAALSCALAGTRDAAPAGADRAAAESLTTADVAFLDTLAQRTFRWMWDQCDPKTLLTYDRAPSKSFASVGAVGFALTAYPIGTERGWVTRAQAAERTRRSLEFLWRAPQDSAVAGSSGYRGFFFHFLHPATGTRFETVELSTVDTALLLAGALFCGGYFDGPSADETRIRALAESLYARADWRWAQPRPPAIVLGWKPESGFLPYDWRGYNEAMILHVLALGSPSHPVGEETWGEWTSRYRWGTFHGEEHLGFGPLFGHQYAHVWIDFRGIRDAYMREHGIDYFENSRRATRAQLAYARANPSGFAGYGDSLWGLTACDGPLDGERPIEGRVRRFRTYAARGASHAGVEDDGTICPSAAGGSIPFLPLESTRMLRALAARYDTLAYNRYGFVDALNPTLDLPLRTQHGRVVPDVGWFDTDQLGIDQGPILAMIENHRSGLVWRVMRRNPHVIRGLRRAGFAGGWLDEADRAR